MKIRDLKAVIVDDAAVKSIHIEELYSSVVWKIL